MTSLNPSAREILDAAGLKDEPLRVPHPAIPGATTMHPVVAAYLGRRSTAFAEATSRPSGKAMTYGTQKKERA